MSESFDAEGNLGEKNISKAGLMLQKGFWKIFRNKTDTILFNTDNGTFLTESMDKISLELVSWLYPITDTDDHLYNLQGKKEKEGGCHPVVVM